MMDAMTIEPIADVASELITELPGPRSREIHARRTRTVARGVG